MATATVNIDISELKTMLEKINETSRKAIKLVDDAIQKTALDIDRDLKETVKKGTRSGRTYRRRSVTHRASAAGEPPKTDTGRLVSSIRPVTSFMSAEVGSLQNVAKYGEFLEEGTSTMEPRPLFKPTHEKFEPIIAKRVSIAIQQSGLAS